MKLISELPTNYVQARLEDLFIISDERTMVRPGIAFCVKCGLMYTDVRISNESSVNLPLLYSDCKAGRVYVSQTNAEPKWQ